jgi:predicted phage terminase large subunit-like protein
MQRLHENDLVGHLKSRFGWLYEHVCLQAEYQPDDLPEHCNKEFTDPRQPGDLLFPELYDAPKLKVLKTALGSYGVASQLQQNPRPYGGGILKRSYFPSYDALLLTPSKDCSDAFFSWDCAVKGGANHDAISGQLWGKVRYDHPHYANRYVLIDLVVFKGDILKTLKMMRDFAEKHPWVREFVIEDKANGSPIITMLKEQLHSYNVIAFDPGARSKETRINAVVPLLEAGMVLINTNGASYVDADGLPVHSWHEPYFLELEAFPKGKHDDQADATSQALLHLSQGNQWVFSM